MFSQCFNILNKYFLIQLYMYQPTSVLYVDMFSPFYILQIFRQPLISCNLQPYKFPLLEQPLIRYVHISSNYLPSI
jgi:hypothetical protein